MYKKFAKRLFDIILAILLLPLVILFYFIIGVCIKLEDRGSIIFKQKRIGKKGIIFKMYKFRSMKENSPDIRNKDGSTFNSKDDARMTKVGGFIRKTSIDEIPQIINVLKGDMSFIGPRPDLPDHYFLYTEEEKEKLNVLPGISGYNQIYYRNSTSWKDRLKNDIYYSRNLNFTLDFKIFFRTILIVLLRKGVYNDRKPCKQSDKETDSKTAS